MLLIRYLVLTDAKVQTKFETSKQKQRKICFLLKNFVLSYLYINKVKFYIIIRLNS